MAWPTATQAALSTSYWPLEHLLSRDFGGAGPSPTPNPWGCNPQSAPPLHVLRAPHPLRASKAAGPSTHGRAHKSGPLPALGPQPGHRGVPGELILYHTSYVLVKTR